MLGMFRRRYENIPTYQLRKPKLFSLHSSINDYLCDLRYKFQVHCNRYTATHVRRFTFVEKGERHVDRRPETLTMIFSSYPHRISFKLIHRFLVKVEVVRISLFPFLLLFAHSNKASPNMRSTQERRVICNFSVSLSLHLTPTVMVFSICYKVA